MDGVDFHRRLLDRITEVHPPDRPPYQGEYVGGDVGLITRLKIEKTQSVYDKTKTRCRFGHGLSSAASAMGSV